MWHRAEVLENVRLLCESYLQVLLDTTHPVESSNDLELDEAFAVIAFIVLRSSNVAVLWETFFNLRQGVGVKVKHFVHR